jgi:8-oxo-dGTP diphosphatase
MAADRPIYRLAVRVFALLPDRLRDFIAHTVSPSFYVGTSPFVTRDDGRLLLVRHSYKPAWGTPGGLMNRGEHADACAIREAWEEVGLRIEIAGEPTVVVDPRQRRIEYVCRARVVDGVDPDSFVISSPEIVEIAWFEPGDMPELQDHAAESLVALLRAEMHRGPTTS